MHPYQHPIYCWFRLRSFTESAADWLGNLEGDRCTGSREKAWLMVIADPNGNELCFPDPTSLATDPSKLNRLYSYWNPRVR